MGARPACDLTALVLAVWFLAAVPTARAQAPEETTLAALSLTFSSTFVAEELGLWSSGYEIRGPCGLRGTSPP